MMTTTNNESPHFANTGLRVVLDPMTPAREVFIPSAEAIAWDGAQDVTNCTILSPAHGVQCYAELKITGRGVRKHRGGVEGLKARVRFTSCHDGIEGDGSTPGGWHDCVVLA